MVINFQADVPKGQISLKSAVVIEATKDKKPYAFQVESGPDYILYMHGKSEGNNNISMMSMEFKVLFLLGS